MEAPQLAQIRCRSANCNNFETADEFKKCGRCRIAKYCSRECQVADWPLHKLMCQTDRVIVNPDGTQQLVTDLLNEHKKETTAASKSPLPQYISPLETGDDDLIRETIERLQLQTNLFVLDQYLKNDQETGFLFIQTESPLEDFRYLSGMKNGERLNRSFICYYMKWNEFVKEVLPEHPNDKMKDRQLLKTLRTELDKCDPKEHVVSLIGFGCGRVATITSEVPPYKTLMEALNEDPNMFDNQDCIELNIDN